MFLNLANFYKQFIKDFNKSTVPLTLIIKKMTPSISSRLSNICRNENELNKKYGNNIGSSRINNKTANLSTSSKKMDSKTSFLIFKASLGFTQLRKVFTKASILYYCDPERHIPIEIEALGYAIVGVLSQYTFEIGLVN